MKILVPVDGSKNSLNAVQFIGSRKTLLGSDSHTPTTGAVGTLAASWTVYGHECQSTCLYGTKGIMLIYNNNNPAAPIEVRNLDGTSTTYNIPPETNSGVIDEFVAALEQNREPEVSGREALSTMRAIFGSIKSSEIGRTVSVNDSYVNHL